LREPTQAAKKQQLATKPSKPFFSFLFALLSQFAKIRRDLYYVFTTVRASAFEAETSHRTGGEKSNSRPSGW